PFPTPSAFTSAPPAPAGSDCPAVNTASCGQETSRSCHMDSHIISPARQTRRQVLASISCRSSTSPTATPPCSTAAMAAPAHSPAASARSTTPQHESSCVRSHSSCPSAVTLPPPTERSVTRCASWPVNSPAHSPAGKPWRPDSPISSSSKRSAPGSPPLPTPAPDGYAPCKTNESAERLKQSTPTLVTNGRSNDSQLSQRCRAHHSARVSQSSSGKHRSRTSPAGG